MYEKPEAFRVIGQFWVARREAPPTPRQPAFICRRDAMQKKVLLRDQLLGAMVRAKVEQPFWVIEWQFGDVKTRYRGLAKNRPQMFTLFAPGNLFLV